MDYSLIGKKIKELRKVAGLTQGDLAENICTQALISRIEKGDIYPSATALYQISIKLGVDINYFFEIGTTPRIDYIKEVERQLRFLRDSRDFDGMIDLVKTEEKNPLFYKDKEKLQLLYWHKGIYKYEVEKDAEASFLTLQKAYDLTAHDKKAMTEREMQILASTGTIHVALHNNQDALYYYKQVEVALRTTEHLQDKSIKTRLFYNIAKVLTRLGQYEKSIKYSKAAINWCFDEELLWGVGELHYQIGYNFELLAHTDKAFPYYQQALHMFEIREDSEYVDFLTSKIETISKGMYEIPHAKYV
ncbi:helix-turn-helix transcriptional regulator [Rossellomorea aquimaris]|uniref:helix-turn-helix domain-containing protein n=1 Tax=Rossellomorea aquimaris TaxID=189382 RepID=UPI001CD6245F|nr:helix-turn-helix domain-containing protein [Rossellomorea aquimaris]MCA1055226.1 helix-turn-helix transcriptional regulator [Rossellomorea aquimaris]